MKTVVVTIESPADGDLAIVQYSAPTGGKTHSKHRIKGARVKPSLVDGDGLVLETEPVPAETAADVAKHLTDAITSEWMKEFFQAKASDNKIIIHCADQVADVTFSVEVAGDGGTKLSLTEF